MSLKTFQAKIGTTADGVVGPNTLKAVAKHFDLTLTQAVHFMAQCAHETNEFRWFEENLNYSENALVRVFGKYFEHVYTGTGKRLASVYARKPEKIANVVYSNRMGNGDEASGDGWKYRGRGAIQLTGRKNYEGLNEYLYDNYYPFNFDVVEDPDVVKDEYAFESAMYYFHKNKLFDRLNDVSVDTIRWLTRRINGGYNGLDHRIELTRKYAAYVL